MFELRVLTGLHRGAALPLSGERWLIGSSADADLALYDPGVETEHCRLERQEDGWSLSALQGQLDDAEGHRVSQIAALQADTPFALAGVWLTLSSANSEWPAEPDAVDSPAEQAPDEPAQAAQADELSAVAEDRTRAAKRSRSWAGPLLVTGLAAAIAASGWILTGEAAIPAQPAEPEKPVPSLLEGKATLLRMIKDRELHERLSLTEEGGSLVLQGSIKKTERALVQRMLAQFNQQYGEALKVIDRTSPLISELPFTIAQINGGLRAHIVTDGGRRIFVGDEIDGLRLVALDDKLLKFEGTQQIEVKW